MLVFCNGLPRSASTWSFNVIKAVLQACFPGEKIQAGPSEAPIKYLKTADPEARHIVIKCHSLTPAARTLARTRAAKVVYTTRDLADALVSGMTAFGDSFDHLLADMIPILELLSFHRATGNAAIVKYREVVGRPQCAVARIGEYLAGDRMTPRIAEEIAERTSYDRMREKVDEINAIAEPGRLVKTLNNSYDPETMLFRNHIGDGRSGKGRAMLNASQLERIDALTREYGLILE